MYSVGSSIYGVNVTTVGEEFTKYDSNNDGKLNFDEFQDMIRDRVLKGANK